MAKRESWTPLLKSYPESRKINSVSVGAETMFTRLLALCDDKANYYGAPALLLVHTFGNRYANGTVSLRDCEQWRTELITAGLVLAYQSEGEVYLHVVNCKKMLRGDIKEDLRFPEFSQALVLQQVPVSVTDSSRMRNESVPSCVVPSSSSSSVASPSASPSPVTTEKHLAPALAGDGDDCPPLEGQITQINTPPEAKKPKKDRAPKAPKKPRERDPYFDGLAELFHIDPAGTGGSRITRLKKLFIEHGADMAEVERRAEVYRTSEKFKGCMLTGEAVEKHWGELAGVAEYKDESIGEGYDSTTTREATPEMLNTKFQPIYGFDWFGDWSHEAKLTAVAAAKGMSLEQYLDCRRAWSDKHGPYTPENPAPPEEAYARPAEATAEQPKESP